MKKSSILTVIIALILPLTVFSQDSNSIIINEIMYDPPGTESSQEWIEIFNRSGEPGDTPDSDTVNIQNWLIADEAEYPGTPNLITEDSLLLQPGQYVILASDSESVDSVFCDCDTCCRIIEVSDGIPTLNNTGDRVVLFNEDSTVVDSMSYAGDCAEGTSFENWAYWSSSFEDTNWGCCLDTITYSTPGSKNSGIPSSLDMEVSSFTIFPTSPATNEEFTLSSLLKNVGFATVSTGTLSFYFDTDGDGSRAPSEKIGECVFRNIPQDSTVRCSTTYSHSEFGSYKVWAVFSSDSNASNNQKSARIVIGELPKKIVINEVEYGPDEGPEWIEIFNRTGQKPIDTSQTAIAPDTVNIKDWTIAEGSSYDSPYTITWRDFLVAPGEFVILTKDSQDFVETHSGSSCRVIEPDDWSALNNGGDFIVLSNELGTEDSMSYAGYCSNVSLERVYYYGSSLEDSNWECCCVPEFVSSPCTTNYCRPNSNDLALDSITYKELGRTGDNFKSKICFHIENVGYEQTDSTQLDYSIENRGDTSSSTSESSLKIPPLSSGDTLKKCFEKLLGRGIWKMTGNLLPDDMNMNNRESTFVNIDYKSPVIINEFMKDALKDDNQWVELYNRTDSTISLDGWSLGDERSVNPIVLQDSADGYLTSGDYLVVAQDISKFNRAYPCSSEVATTEDWGTLNSSEDDIRLKDSKEIKMDSLHYINDWIEECEKDGFSVARIKPHRPTNASDNWWCQLSKYTPGWANDFDSKFNVWVDRKSFNPKANGRITIHYELPPHSTLKLLLYDMKGRKVKTFITREQFQEAKIEWRGKNNGSILPLGMYMLYAEADIFGEIKVKKIPIVVARDLK